MPAASRYRLVKCLGRGGAAEVYEAYLTGDGGFERRVAVKRLLESLQNDESSLKSFQDEARIASQLHHANIAGVIDFGVQDDLPFIALEYVDGIDAGKLFRLADAQGTEVPESIALHITTEIGHALDYAHEAVDSQGRRMAIVHRDVSPDNILVSWAGDVKLTDFGIARAIKRLEQTRVGIAKGKLNYMSPEQIRAANIDSRTDIFALGCVLHALLTGRSPISRDLQLNTAPPAIDESLEADIIAIIERAISYAPRDRFQSAREMAGACGTALAKRLTRDARTTMREWIAPLAASMAKQPKKPAVDLLDIELVLMEDKPEEGLRRFASTIARPPSGEMEPTRATEVDPRLGRKASDDTAITDPNPHAAQNTVSTARQMDAQVIGRSGSETPPMALAHHAISVTPSMPVPAADPTAIRPHVPPTLQLYAANDSGPVQTRVPPMHLGAIGLGLGAIALVTFVITLMLHPGSSSEPIVEVRPPTQPAAEPLAPAVAVKARAPEPEPARAPVAPVEPPKPTRAGQERAAAPPTTAELRAPLDRALTARGLVLDDLEASDPPIAELDRYRRTMADPHPTAADMRAAVDALVSRVRSVSISPAIVKKKLARVSARLEQLPAADRADPEKRYFELRKELRPQSSDAECEALAQKISAFESELRKLTPR